MCILNFYVFITREMIKGSSITGERFNVAYLSLNWHDEIDKQHRLQTMKFYHGNNDKTPQILALVMSKCY